jgi:tubulin polyglutamylase TTLL4
MNELSALFDSAPLPYGIVTMPSEDEPAVEANSSGYAAHFYNGAHDQILRALVNCGFRFLKLPNAAIVIIGARMDPEQLANIKIWTRASHFSNATLIGGKAELHRRMRELRGRLGHDIPYYPRAFYPPDEYEELVEVWHSVPIWIIKAPALSRARAIHLSHPTDEPAPMLPYVVEEYIRRPLLITGRKFDIRLYVLVTSVFPMVFYFHQNGLCLFATSPYDEDGDLADLRMHITNYEINHHSENFVQCEGLNERIEDSKWSLHFFWRYLESQGIDASKVKADIEDVATSAVIAGMCAVRNDHERDIQRNRRCSFELLGIDLLVDQELKVWLLEINITPAMFGSSELDIFVKNQVIYDMLNTVRMLDYKIGDVTPCKEYTRIERIMRHSRSTDRIQKVTRRAVKPWDNPTFFDHMIIREFVDEQMRKRRFYRAYPKRKTMDRYAKCFDRFTYEDIVLGDWIKLDGPGRIAALRTNWDAHMEEMKKTFPPSGNPYAQACHVV